MFKTVLITIPVTMLVILVTGLLSELCCCASPSAAVFLGLAAGLLCAYFEKPVRKDRAMNRGAIAGAIAGIAALPAQVLGEIVVALALAGSGRVDISLFGLPGASATVDLWNWALNALFAASLYGLTAAVVMAGMGAVGGALWLRFSRKGTPDVEAEQPVEPPNPAADATGKMLMAGAIMAAIAFVFMLLIATNWGCLAVPAALIMGSITGVFTCNLAKPSTPSRAAVFGGIAGMIAAAGSLVGEIVGLLIRTFLIQTPQGINSMTEGFYRMMGMAGSYDARTPAEILAGDIPTVCCCGFLYLAIFVGLGALGGFLWARNRSKAPAGPAAPAAGVPTP
jgi:hypothetical protein